MILLCLMIVVATLLMLTLLGETVTILWGGSQIILHPGFVAFVVFVFFIVLAGLFKLQSAWYRWRQRRQIRKDSQRVDTAKDWLVKNLMALSAGDRTLAYESAQKLRKLEGETPLTTLIQVHTTALLGDEAGRLKAVRTLLLHSQTQDYAQQLLLRQALKDRDWKRADLMVTQTLSEDPKRSWALEMKIPLLARQGDWNAALSLFEDLYLKRTWWPHRRRQGGQRQALSPKRRDDMASALYTACGRHAGVDSSTNAARLFLNALKHTPTFIPAVVSLAELWGMEGRTMRAARLLRKAWATSPHPECLEAWFHLHKAVEPVLRFRLTEKLTRASPEHPLSRQALAQQAWSAGLTGICQKHCLWLQEHAHHFPLTPSVVALFSRLNLAQHADSGSAETSSHTIQNPNVSQAPQWVCTACHHTPATWQALCDGCNTLGTLSWETPHFTKKEDPHPLSLAY